MLAAELRPQGFTRFELQALDRGLVSGRFELQELLSRGATADIYLATDRCLDRQVAVKLLHPDLADDGAFAARFEREARAAAALSHPNVVGVFDYGIAGVDDLFWLPPRREAVTANLTHRLESRTVPFIVIEYVPGPTLKAIARERAPLPEADALDIGAQIAAALDAAHRRGLVHRNVKPENVLLPANGVAKVTDFGLARAIGAAQLTATRTVLGTAHYTSPEQTLGRRVDGRSDLYSLGVILYELLTGQVPFVAESVVAVAWQHVYDAPTPLRQLRPDLSPATEALVLRSLSKDPARRFQTAAEMGEAFEEASNSLRSHRRVAGSSCDESAGTRASGGANALGSRSRGSVGGATFALPSMVPVTSVPAAAGRRAAPAPPRVRHTERRAPAQRQQLARSLPRLGALLALAVSSVAAGAWLLWRLAGLAP